MSHVIFVDTEGNPVQELAAICINDTSDIIDTYLQYCRCSFSDDLYARKHVHGLNPVFLERKGFHCTSDLLHDFMFWITGPNLILN